MIPRSPLFSSPPKSLRLVWPHLSLRSSYTMMGTVPSSTSKSPPVRQPSPPVLLKYATHKICTAWQVGCILRRMTQYMCCFPVHEGGGYTLPDRRCATATQMVCWSRSACFASCTAGDTAVSDSIFACLTTRHERRAWRCAGVRVRPPPRRVRT